jgi:hypothetical protein
MISERTLEIDDAAEFVGSVLEAAKNGSITVVLAHRRFHVDYLRSSLLG